MYIDLEADKTLFIYNESLSRYGLYKAIFDASVNPPSKSVKKESTWAMVATTPLTSDPNFDNIRLFKISPRALGIILENNLTIILYALLFVLKIILPSLLIASLLMLSY